LLLISRIVGEENVPGEVAIVGIGETPFSRGRVDKGELRLTAEEYYAWAIELALRDAGLSKKDLDRQGLAVCGSEWPHSEIWSAELAQNLGLTPKLLLRGDSGGMNGAGLLIQSALAIRRGFVDLVLCVGADAPLSMEGAGSRTWRYEQDFMKPFGMMGPNSIISFVMRRHMHQYLTKPEQTGKIAVTQRYNAMLNPNAYLRTPITLEDYMKSRLIADPVRLLDCCILVNGGSAFIVVSKERAKNISENSIPIKGFGELHNFYEGSPNNPDVTVTGLKVAAKQAYDMAGVKPSQVDVFEAYDDYTIIVLMQLEDAGFCKKGQGGKFVEDNDIGLSGQLAVNTSGGQLSAGQPGMAGGFTHIIEAVRQLRGQGGQRQVGDAKVALVSGLGGLAFGGSLLNSAAVILGAET
jgi:acetyl-CoA acetyltransferase